MWAGGRIDGRGEQRFSNNNARKRSPAANNHKLSRIIYLVPWRTRAVAIAQSARERARVQD